MKQVLLCPWLAFGNLKNNSRDYLPFFARGISRAFISGKGVLDSTKGRMILSPREKGDYLPFLGAASLIICLFFTVCNLSESSGFAKSIPGSGTLHGLMSVADSQGGRGDSGGVVGGDARQPQQQLGRKAHQQHPRHQSHRQGKEKAVQRFKKLLKDDRSGEKDPKFGIVGGILGLLLLAGGYTVAVRAYYDPNLILLVIPLFFVAALLVALGTYGVFIFGHPYPAHHHEAVPVLVAFGDLLVVHHQHGAEEKGDPEEQSQKGQGAEKDREFLRAGQRPSPSPG